MKYCVKTEKNEQFFGNLWLNVGGMESNGTKYNFLLPRAILFSLWKLGLQNRTDQFCIAKMDFQNRPKMAKNWKLDLTTVRAFVTTIQTGGIPNLPILVSEASLPGRICAKFRLGATWNVHM